jgi:hypothetical protein
MGRVKLTEAQRHILGKLAAGHRIVYSRDGDCGWISGEKEHLSDFDIWALRDAGCLDREIDEREDDYGCDLISPAGRAILAKENRDQDESPDDQGEDHLGEKP